MDFNRLAEVILTPSNSFVLVAITVLFFFSLFLDFSNKKPNLVAITPNLLTSIGILGTFWGIFIGLLYFDVHNIDESIPHLLEGMKTAFFSSLCGIASAILFKIIRGVFVKIQSEDVGAAEIHESLESLRESINESINQTNKCQAPNFRSSFKVSV